MKSKPVKLNRFLKHNAPKERKFGSKAHSCRLCGNPRAHIGKYGLDLCRRCFRDVAHDIGFKKYN
ncbi:MAG: 30S ribosomal protein S14 [Nanoarchaeota archaeon]